MQFNLKRIGLAICLALALCCEAEGDAIVVTKAMTASTIAEIFIENDEVKIELEIGVEDLDAFCNVLPDELYEKHGFYSEVIEKIKANETLDDSLRKVALQIANSRLLEDEEKKEEPVSDEK